MADEQTDDKPGDSPIGEADEIDFGIGFDGDISDKDQLISLFAASSGLVVEGDSD